MSILPPQNPGRVTTLLRKILPYKDIGWAEIGEEFTRFQLIKTPWFNIYLHRLLALTAHGKCHDHPWSFISVLLRGGYYEFSGDVWVWQKPGSVLYRPAEWRHNVVTTDVAWSLIITGPRRRDWGFRETCHMGDE